MNINFDKLRLMDLFGKRQQLVICILAAILMLDFVLFGYMPLKDRLSDVNQKKQSQQHLLSQATTERSQLPILEDQLCDLNEKVRAYNANVPTERKLGLFLQQITGLMNAHNLTGQIIQPGQEIKTEKLNCVPVDMTCAGTLKQLFSFYRSLEDLDRLVRIEQVKLQNEQDFSGKVHMFTKAYVYYRPSIGKR